MKRIEAQNPLPRSNSAVYLVAFFSFEFDSFDHAIECMLIDRILRDESFISPGTIWLIMGSLELCGTVAEVDESHGLSLEF